VYLLTAHPPQGVQLLRIFTRGLWLPPKKEALNRSKRAKKKLAKSQGKSLSVQNKVNKINGLRKNEF